MAWMPGRLRPRHSAISDRRTSATSRSGELVPAPHYCPHSCQAEATGCSALALRPPAGGQLGVKSGSLMGPWRILGTVSEAEGMKELVVARDERSIASG